MNLCFVFLICGCSTFWNRNWMSSFLEPKIVHSLCKLQVIDWMDIVTFGIELTFKFNFYFFVHNILFEVSVYEATHFFFNKNGCSAFCNRALYIFFPFFRLTPVSPHLYCPSVSFTVPLSSFTLSWVLTWQILYMPLILLICYQCYSICYVKF